MKAMIRILIFFATLVLLLSGCSPASSIAGGNSVWIDVPVDGIHVPDGTVLPIEGHASSADGVSRIEIWINGSLQFELHELSAIDELYSFSQTWTPPTVGEYTIQVVAIGEDGSASEADSVRVQVGEIVITPTLVISPTPVDMPPDDITPTPVVTETFTPTPLPAASTIQFYSYPPEIAAGACATLYWNVENAQRVIFGGLEQPFGGSYETCLCANERYTLTVVNLDGTEERRTVDVNVSGSCSPPTDTPTPTIVPPADTTPPPAPAPSSPSNGSVVACASTQTLTWAAVTDPSGITGYYVKLEKEITAGNWQSAGGYGPVNGTQVSVNIDCGIHYRWMVRAQDGAGNYSGWSAPSEFGVNLN